LAEPRAKANARKNKEAANSTASRMKRKRHGLDPNRVLQQRINQESSEEDSSCTEVDEEFNISFEEFNEMKVRNTYNDIRRYIMLRYDK
jgi:hypothetical protein